MKKIFIGLLGLFSFQLSAQSITDSTKVINGITYIKHKVSSGETLYRLSKNHHTTVDHLKDINNNLTTLKLGSIIWVPSPITTNHTTGKTNEFYTVQTGETLYAISKKLNVSISNIKKWNELNSNSISVGQVLKIKSAAAPVVKETVQATTDQVLENPVPVKVEVANTADVSETSVKSEAPKKKPIEVKRADETTERGMASVINTGNMKAERCFIKHPSVPIGNIVVVINEKTGKMAYCRVIENISSEALNESTIQMTKTVAEKIGLNADAGEVTIKYATL